MSLSRPRFQVPHVFVLLLGVIAVCSLLTWVIPSGSYDRQSKIIEGKERTLLVPGTFQHVEKHFSLKGALLGDPVADKATPVGIQSFLSAIPRGTAKLQSGAFAGAKLSPHHTRKQRSALASRATKSTHRAA